MRHRKQKAIYDKKYRSKETPEERDKRNRRRRELYATNSEPRRSYNREWKRAHPEVVALQGQRRRARLRDAKGEFMQEDWEYIKGLFGNKCAYCGRRKPLTIDHIIPLAKGGQHDKSNIVPTCINCNSQKHVSLSGWPIMTNRRNVIAFYIKTLDDCKRMAVAFAESVG